MNLALESALSHFDQKGGVLYINGIPVTSLVERYGTPVYFYDRSVIEWRYKTLRKYIPESIRILYAVKANPNPQIIKIMGSLYDGFDIASQGEMERVINEGLPPQSINFAGPGKSVRELTYSVQNSIGSISVESEDEIRVLDKICCDINKNVNILIRVNPGFDTSQSGMKMGGGPKPFGIDSEKVPDILSGIRQYNNINFKGIHIFANSQNLNPDVLLDTYKKILEYTAQLSTDLHIKIPVINLGGGFGVPYFAVDTELDLKTIGHGLKKITHDYRVKFPDTIFFLELGRFLVAECGVYICRVLYKKISRNKTFLVTDGGMHHHISASGNLGQNLTRRPMPVTVANKLMGKLNKKVTVAGRLCTPLDSFGTVDIPEAGEKDLIVIFQSGAYGFSASPLYFLSHELPGEVVV